jgi:hypothetical protein
VGDDQSAVKYCESVAGGWLWGDPEMKRSDDVALGDFDGDGVSDVFWIEESPYRWVISYKGLGPSRVVRGDLPTNEGNATNDTGNPATTAQHPFLVTTLDDESDVDPLSDPDDLSLREAIDLANTNGNAFHTITFDPTMFGSPQIVTPTLGHLQIANSLTIEGPGHGLLTIDAQHASRAIMIDDNDADRLADVSLAGLTLTHGLATD